MVEQCRAIAVEALQRDGVFASPSGNNWRLYWLDAYGNTDAFLDYSVVQSDEGMALCLGRAVYDLPRIIELSGENRVQITSSRPHFGGKRFWFRCPLVREGKTCGRRVGRLYLPPGQHVFGCRLCHNLIHRSARKHDARVYKLARDPAAWKAAAADKRVRMKSLAASAIILSLQQEHRRARQRGRC